VALLSEDADVVGSIDGVFVVSTDSIVHVGDEVMSCVSGLQSGLDQGSQITIAPRSVTVDKPINV